MEYVHASTLEGWREVPVFNGLSSYEIVGPDGRIACKLLAWGKVIRGSDHMGNKREVLVHSEISERTGLNAETGFTMTPEQLMKECRENPMGSVVIPDVPTSAPGRFQINPDSPPISAAMLGTAEPEGPSPTDVLPPSVRAKAKPKT